MEANNIDEYIRSQKEKIKEETLSLEEVVKEEVDKAFASGKHIGYIEGYLDGLSFLQKQITQKQEYLKNSTEDESIDSQIN